MITTEGTVPTAVVRMSRFRAALSVEADTWYADAACAQADPEVFFPTGGKHDSVHAAKKVCMTCEARLKCLEAAMERPELHGIWGGMTSRERQRLRTKQRNQKEAAS